MSIPAQRPAIQLWKFSGQAGRASLMFAACAATFASACQMAAPMVLWRMDPIDPAIPLQQAGCMSVSQDFPASREVSELAGVTWHEYGRGDGQAIVLLHPIATNHSVWWQQISHWQDRFRVISLDLPGHGRDPDAGSADTMAAIAESVALSLKSGGLSQCILVGLSLGSMIAQRIAAEFPDLARAVVLANAISHAGKPIAKAWADRIAEAQVNRMEGIADSTLARWFTADFLSASPAAVARVRAMILATPLEGYLATARAIARLDNSPLLPRIDCPALVLAGSQDVAAPPAAVEAVARQVPSSRFLCIDAPHLAQVEQPDLFNRVVDAFLLAECPEITP